MVIGPDPVGAILNHRGFKPRRLIGQRYPSREIHGLKCQVHIRPQLSRFDIAFVTLVPSCHTTVGIISRPGLRPFERPPWSTGPLLREGYVVPRINTPTTRSASLEDSRRFPSFPGYTAGPCPTT